MALGVANLVLIGKEISNNTMTFYERKPLTKNITENKKKKEKIRREYLKKYEKWEKEIEEENRLIKKINIELEQYNNSLPQQSVRYK